MVSRRDFLQALLVSGAFGLSGCNTLTGGTTDRNSTQERTRTTVSTPTTTSTIAEQIGTPVFEPDSSVDEFGHAVALSATTAIVVAEDHGAYVFEAGSDGWTNATALAPTNREDFDGTVSAALVGDRATIGGSDAEAVSLFERTDDGWSQRHRFEPDETEAGEFGRSVAFDGDRVVVGDANDPTAMASYVGHASVYASDDEGWTREASVTTGAEDRFGTAVAVDGETVLVGAPSAEPDENPTGAVYVYELVDESWQRGAVLTPADPPDVDHGNRFGHAVAFADGTAVVGAPGGTGRAYVFERTSTGWTQTARVTVPDVEDGAQFGRSVALADGTVVVGASRAHETGRAYIFTASDAWTEPLRLGPADPHEDAAFGAAVALSETTALVGAPASRAASGAYLFDL